MPLVIHSFGSGHIHTCACTRTSTHTHTHTDMNTYRHSQTIAILRTGLGEAKFFWSGRLQG